VTWQVVLQRDLRVDFNEADGKNHIILQNNGPYEHILEYHISYLYHPIILYEITSYGLPHVM